VVNTAVIIATDQPQHTSTLLMDRPKAMFPVVGKPLVVRVMEQLYQAGIRHFFVVVGVNEGAVAQYLHKSWKPDTKIELSLLTPMDDLWMVLQRIAKQVGEPFILTTYNSVSQENFGGSLLRAYTRQPADMLLTATRKTLGELREAVYADDDADSITLSDRQAAFTLHDLAVVGGTFTEFLETANPDPKAALRHDFWGIVRHYLSKYPTRNRLLETSWIMKVQSDKELLLLNERMLEDNHDTHILSELPLSVKIVQPVRIDPQVTVGENATIGPNVYLERGTRIGIGAKISHTMVLARAIVPANAILQNTIVTPRGQLK
jgi:NDP-sugar pyrophosphorylase family protein